MQKTKLFVNGRWRDVPVESLHKMLAHGVVGEDTLIIVDDVTSRLGDTDLLKRRPAERAGLSKTPNGESSGLPVSGAVPPPFAASVVASGIIGAESPRYGQEIKYRRNNRWIWIVSAIGVALLVVVVGGLLLARSGGNIGAFSQSGDLTQKRKAVSAVMNQVSEPSGEWLAQTQRIDAIVAEAESGQGGGLGGTTVVGGSSSSVTTVVSGSPSIAAVIQETKAIASVYLDRISSIDVSSCPDDFVEEWNGHLYALSGMIKLLDDMLQYDWNDATAWSDFDSLKNDMDIIVIEHARHLMEIAESYGWKEE